MAILTISTVDLTGTAQSIPVGIETCDINGVPVRALTSTSVVVPSEYRETDASGNLSIDLIPNASLNPTNTFYKVTLAGGTWIILKSSATQTIIQALAATPSALSSGTALVGATGATGPAGPGITGGAIKSVLKKNTAVDYDASYSSTVFRAAVSNTPVTVSNTITETALFTIPTKTTAQGSAVGDMYRIVAWGTLLNNDVSTGHTFRLKVGATTVLASNTITFGTNANNRSWKLEAHIVYMSSANQSVVATLDLGSATAQAWDDVPAANALTGNATSAEDFTVAKNIVFTVAMGNASTLTTFTLNGYYMEQVY